ncbi:hypothetical protein [Flavobacterium sp. CS20]|uniref:hypothetical protein n=1 Tax=Flavobacterium sp. CS20 TaxID=2775246 RepID=UPI001B3A2B72|nr:hypothetical protein [Flavobacterium sp. CS20]QTY27188.1 hypothetical protein IGB25_00875 [Flavobacterium sp. CS20]
MDNLDKEKVISNVAALLQEVPSSMEIIKDDKHKEKRFRYLAKHMVDKAIERDALIVSEDYNGIAILFEEDPNRKVSFWKELMTDIKLALKVTGIKKGLKALKIQGYVKKQSPKDKNHLYCWFWGIMPEARDVDKTKTAYNMKNQFMELSKQKKLPIYAETRIKRVYIAYRRYKFDCFHQWQHPSGDTMYFMKYKPSES